MIRLIATDLDGTLLVGPPGRGRPTPRTLEVLQRARDAGLIIVPASGRQPFSIAEALAGTFLADGIVLGANGAIGQHLGTGEVYFERLLTAQAQTELFTRLRELFPNLRCVSVRDQGRSFFPQHGYVGYMDPGDHGRRGPQPEYDLADVLGTPSLKFIVRDPDAPIDVLLDAALALEVPGCHPVTSGAPFIEVSAAGVTKGSGLADLCAALAIEAGEVVAFGDHLNDLEMLAWAGHSVAVANALPEVTAIADETAPANTDEGVARVVARLLAERGA